MLNRIVDFRGQCLKLFGCVWVMAACLGIELPMSYTTANRVCMKAGDLALDESQGLICHKTPTNKKKKKDT